MRPGLLGSLRSTWSGAYSVTVAAPVTVPVNHPSPALFTVSWMTPLPTVSIRAKSTASAFVGDEKQLGGNGVPTKACSVKWTVSLHGATVGGPLRGPHDG